MSLYLLFSILIFLAVTLGLGGWLMYRGGATGRTIAERLGGVGRREFDVHTGRAIERDERMSGIPWLDRLLRSVRIGAHLDMLLYQAGSSMRPGVLVLVIAVFAVAGWLLGAWLYAHFYSNLKGALPIQFVQQMLLGVISMVLVGSIPYLAVVYQKHQRMKAFAQEFPDALDLLVSGLRAGLSFTAAMQIVSEESPEPVRSEFAVTVEEQALGIDFREALVNLTKRVDSLDLRFFVTAVILQRDTGGNLAEILENTAKLIRDRFRILGDIQTFTAQGRLTGWILMCLPLAIALYTMLLIPGYFDPMYASPGGRMALFVAGSMQLLGMYVIRRIVNIKV